MRAWRSTLLVFAFSIVPLNASVISFVDVFRIQVDTQTTATQPTTPGYFLGARAHLQNVNDFNGGTFNGSSPLTASGSLTLAYGSPLYSSLSAFNSAYPLVNDYLFHLTDSTAANPNAPQDLSALNLGIAPYPTSIPYLTDYSALAGYNANTDFTFTWNPFTGPTSDSFVFFEITRASDGLPLYNAPFLPSTATSVTVPGGKLAPNTQYDFSIIFSNRIGSTERGVSGSAVQLGFDSRTDGLFTLSSAPEPATVVLTFLGVFALIVVKRGVHPVLQ